MSNKIVLEGVVLENLIDDLVKWENVENDWYDHIGEEMWKNWKRSPSLREARRESIVYGNCLETIKVALGRHEVNRMMCEAREKRLRTENEDNNRC